MFVKLICVRIVTVVDKHSVDKLVPIGFVVNNRDATDLDSLYNVDRCIGQVGYPK